MAKTTVIHDLMNTLPFHDVLSWEQFQALCTDVLYKRYNSIDSREYLVKGSAQQGIDAYTIRRGEEKLTVAQCKLKQYLGPKEVLEIVDEFLKGNLVGETKQFILCTSADLGRQRDEQETIAKARAKLAPFGIEFISWDERGISKELRTDPSPEVINIVYRYFDENIALAFYGEIWSDYVKKLRKVEKHKYERGLDYIEREIVAYNDSLKESEPSVWSRWNHPDKFTLPRLIEECAGKESRKVVLLSTAGFGKTEELRNVAGYFSADLKLLYPVLFSLKNYVGQPIDMVLSAYSTDWRNIEEECLLLLFDGLDEAPDRWTHHFIGQLNAFVEQHPKVHIVVSSRYNFYDVKHPQLSGFETHLLKPLTYSDIQRYLTERLGADKAEFDELLSARKFSEYASSPYYLTRFVRFFNEESAFPKNKTELFSRILFERLEKDGGRYNIPELKNRLLPIARKVAFCMTVAGRSALSEEEMKVVVPNGETKKLLNHFGILNCNAAGIGSWAFEHKNLQEYLCASVFAESTFPKVHQVVSSNLNRNKLLPQFLNTISFLFELVKPSSVHFKELFTWLHTNEPELLVRFEKEQVSREVRLEIFKEIFQYYKQQKRTLRTSTNFTYEELAHFVEVDGKLIEFFTTQMKEGLMPNHVYDLISILEYGKRLFRYRTELSDLLFDVLNDPSQQPIVAAKAITAFRPMGFKDNAVFEKIRNSGVDTQVYEIRRALVSFLAETNYFEDYSRFILDSIAILVEGQKQNNSSSSSLSMVNHLVVKFNRPDKIREVFQYCITNRTCIDHYRRRGGCHFELSEVTTLLEKAAEGYREQPALLPIIYRLYCGMGHLSLDQQWFQPFKSFFENTCGTRVIFQKFYRYDRNHRDILAFADEWCCDFLINGYKLGEIPDEEIAIFRNVLSNRNWALFLYFYEQLKDLGEGKFIVDTTTNYNEIFQKQEEKNQHMLLDKAVFLEEADEIFSIIAKENVTPKDLWFSDTKELSKFQASLVFEAIRDMCVHDDDKMITKEQFIRRYDHPQDWQWLVVESTVALLKNSSKRSTVHEILLKDLQEWCKKMIETLNFENCIRDSDDHSFTLNPTIEFVKEVFLLLHLDLEDRLLVKMLPADHESFYGWNEDSQETISSVITEQVQDKDLLHKSVINNITSGDLAILVLCSHFTICHRMGYSECLGALYDCIINHPLLQDYNRVKLTDYYLDMGGEITDFASCLKTPDVQSDESAYTSWQWYLLEKLQYIEIGKSTTILRSILDGNASNENRLKAAEQLIRLSRIEGLEYWAVHVRKYKVWPFEHRWASLQPFIVRLPKERAIQLFLSVMEFAYENSLQSGFAGYYFIEESIYASLINLSQNEPGYYSSIKESIQGMIARFADEPFVDSIRFYSDRFTQRYYENKVPEIGVRAAQLIYEQSFGDG